MSITDAELEAARALVRSALTAADNGNHAGERAVLAMAAWGEMLGLLKSASCRLAEVERNTYHEAEHDDIDALLARLEGA